MIATRKPAGLLRQAALFAGAVAMWTGTAQAQCTGDCNSNGEVTVDELVTMVNIALGTAALTACEVGDANGNGEVTVDEIIRAVNFALTECPSACAATVAVNLGFDENSVTELAGVTVHLDYPPTKVGLPNDELTSRVTDIGDARGMFEAQDVDSSGGAADDQLRVSYATSSTILPGALVSVRFDCATGTAPPAADEFTCSVQNAADGGGLAVEGVTCSIALLP